MQAVLYDIQAAEVYSTMAGKDSTKDFTDKNDDSLAVYYASILKHHGLSQQEFQDGMAWYRAHPADLDSVYLKMLPVIESNGVKADKHGPHLPQEP